MWPGLTLLGGGAVRACRTRPAVAELLRQVRGALPRQKCVGLYGLSCSTGTCCPARVGDAALVREMLGCIDVLVDGPFVLGEKGPCCCGSAARPTSGSSTFRRRWHPAGSSCGTTAINAEGIMMQKVPVKKFCARARRSRPTARPTRPGPICAPVWTLPSRLRPARRRLIPIGIAMEIPEGYVGLVFARSGLASQPRSGPGQQGRRCRLRLSRGILRPHAQPRRTARRPSSRASALPSSSSHPISRRSSLRPETLTDTARGEGGFGSTGAK